MWALGVSKVRGKVDDLGVAGSRGAEGIFFNDLLVTGTQVVAATMVGTTPRGLVYDGFVCAASFRVFRGLLRLLGLFDKGLFSTWRNYGRFIG